MRLLIFHLILGIVNFGPNKMRVQAQGGGMLSQTSVRNMVFTQFPMMKTKSKIVSDFYKTCQLSSCFCSSLPKEAKYGEPKKIDLTKPNEHEEMKGLDVLISKHFTFKDPKKAVLDAAGALEKSRAARQKTITSNTLLELTSPEVDIMPVNLDTADRTNKGYVEASPHLLIFADVSGAFECREMFEEGKASCLKTISNKKTLIAVLPESGHFVTYLPAYQKSFDFAEIAKSVDRSNLKTYLELTSKSTEMKEKFEFSGDFYEIAAENPGHCTMNSFKYDTNTKKFRWNYNSLPIDLNVEMNDKSYESNIRKLKLNVEMPVSPGKDGQEQVPSVSRDTFGVTWDDRELPKRTREISMGPVVDLIQNEYKKVVAERFKENLAYLENLEKIL
eukprot:TRINITY_DN21081_c0_g1_i1.p1 TRINITY_DN21081_c0_g1~~TRINITY_DN21081_c0_g1_i1.p1  ORF type:complete len:389 (-),score=29.43 TRINITY_DN21081_c0_g1_i1:133-1299(-)